MHNHTWEARSPAFFCKEYFDWHSWVSCFSELLICGYMPCCWVTTGSFLRLNTSRMPRETHSYIRTDHPAPSAVFQHRTGFKFRVPQETLWPHCEVWRMSNPQHFFVFYIEHQHLFVPLAFRLSIVVATINSIIDCRGYHRCTHSVVNSA